jgi:hypothetical protein
VGPIGPAGPANVKIRKVLNHVQYNTPSSWTTTYTASGSSLEIRAQITGYIVGVASAEYQLLEDGNVIDAGFYYFTTSRVHMLLPDLIAILGPRTGTHTYSIQPFGVRVDNNDYCTMIITEF